ncbi:MAG TPA: DUF2147 domain-containing protein [Xanthobacteraceae bacterium]|jgi:uncharacterized protein (DUF2147 family)|nr:DUF2147 domain-containing protein [Xanthobacteraceae bacterium]
MRAKIAIIATALWPLIAPISAISADQQTPLGLWQAVDDKTKEPTGWFLISDHNGVYSGIIARMFNKPGDNPNAVCDQCKDDRQGHPWLGLEIIRGMAPEGDAKFGGGNILDPRDGKIYHATMKVTPDGQTLIVRGYIGFEMLGQNQYWTRLPDSAYSMLDPSVAPNAQGGVKHPPASGQHKSDLGLRPATSTTAGR